MLTKREAKILKSIVIPSENDPTKPEFPPEHPRFPATPTYKIKVPGFSNVWLKDESVNPTGTHKDRMAWEMVVTYKQFLRRKRDAGWIKKLPELSILSSGSAALAIQFQLREYGLPNLRVLMDKNTDGRIVDFLQSMGCKMFPHPLSSEMLTWRDILRLTKNPDGFDITSNAAFDPTVRFYDWMSYEILASRADYVLCPYGTGQLYENILNIAKREGATSKHDPRFQSTPALISKCNFLGATSTNPRTLADKLYAPFLPFAGYNEQWINYYRYAGFCGKESRVWNIEEHYILQAMNLAKSQKITAEPSGLAGLALLIQLQKKLPRNKKYLIINTGHTKLPFDLYHNL